MAKIPRPSTDPIAAAIFRGMEENAGDWRRDHLGCSIIGRPCSRELWYSFHWCTDPKFPGRILRLFERGQNEENGLAQAMRLAGMKVQQYEEGSDRQLRVKFGPHVGGSRDGTVTGVPGAPKTAHVWECKTTNLAGFRKLKKDGVKNAKPEHWAQMQMYMLGSKLKRALYTAVCKDNDDIHAERVRLDEQAATALVAKAQAVVDAPEPPERLSSNPGWYQCKWCDHQDLCHFERVEKLERNCRTCASSTPGDDGSWSCEEHEKKLTSTEQRQGCEDHLYIPALLPWPAAHYDDDTRTMYYRRGERLIADHGGELK